MRHERPAGTLSTPRRSPEPTQLCPWRSCSSLMEASQPLSTRAAWTLSWGEDTPGADEAGAKLLAEVARLLEARKGSVYFCVTLAQSHVSSESFDMHMTHRRPSCSCSVDD